MFRRVTHAAIAFAVTAVLYQGYVLAVAPFIEPQWSPANRATIADEPLESGVDALHRHRALLAKYFPPDHWCFARPPKTLGNGRMLVVFDDYQQSASGELRAPLCAVVFFPHLQTRAGPAPDDAIILESSGGAVLQMEQALDKGVRGFGDVQYGQLRGEVTVRSAMTSPGPEDDLLIKTRDLYMNEDLIRTDQPVDIKLGDHHGYGRELEIRRLKTEGSAGAGAAALYGSIEDLVIKHDVQVSVAPGKARLFRPPGSPAAAASASTDAPPIRIKSAGPFRIDFGNYKATFSDEVRAWQIQADGKMDELLADELTLFFTKATNWNSAAGGVAPAAGEESLTLEPASIEARGKPVVLKAPSRDASGRGERLWIELASGGLDRITLDEGEEVVLAHQGAEIHARTLAYQFPPKGSPQLLGALSARDGGGWLRAAPDPARPDQIVEVRWTDAMQLVRRNGQPILVLDGRPNVSMSGAGTLWADQLQVFLRETPGAAATRGGAFGSLAAAVTVERITASGSVDLQSLELTGKVNQLEINIDNAPAAAGAAGAGDAAAGQGPPGMAALAGASGGPRRMYDVAGITLRVDAALVQRRAVVRGLRVEGSVVFEERPDGAVASAPPPLRIVAERLQVTGADTPQARIEIAGGGGKNGLPASLAEITARGAKLTAPAIVVNRGANPATINSPGVLELPVDRDLSGNPLAQPERLAITWQESMKLEGRRITFLGDVNVQNSSGQLRTRRLVAQTAAPIRFDGGGEQPQVEQFECWEGAAAQFDQREVSGVTSRQAIELESLVVNQATGAISGEGPGHVDSIHLSKSPAALLALPAGGPKPPELVEAKPELRHLHIDFVRAVSGNLRTRTVNVHGDVQAIYGPVDNWQQRLEMSPGGAPRQGEVWITCQTLGVTESPLARLAGAAARQVELMAEGRVIIEGQDPRQGSFTAQGHRAKFDQSKGLFILEGDGVTPATIQRQQFAGAPSSPQSAQRMEFNQLTGRVKIDGLHKGEINQIDLGRQPGAPPR
jgi:hypothetical protein